MRYPGIRSTLAATVAIHAVAISTPAYAQTKSFNVPEQPAVSGIPELARQADVQILVSESVVRGKMTRAVKGRMPIEQALRQLLRGTGLKVSSSDGRTFMLTTGRAVPTTATPIGDQPTSIETSDIVVTGSRLTRSADEGPEEVKTYKRADIERSGQATTTGFLNTLPEVSTSVREIGGNLGGVTLGQSTVSLRGLPIGSTLVLVNGRRVDSGAGSTGIYFDLNTIPVAAIDRIEIVPTGSSAVYGSNALAGVVNIILKKDFNGVELDSHYGGASGTDEVSTSLAVGKVWSRGSISLIGSYLKRTELNNGERAITSNDDFTRYATLGGKDTRSSNCFPGNIATTSGQKLPGLTSASASIPVGVSTPTAQDFFSTAGVTQKCSLYAQLAAIPSTERFSLSSYATYKISDDIELFGEGMFFNGTQRSYTYNTQINGITIPATNAYNPFGVAIKLNALIPTKRQGNEAETNFYRALAGLRGSIGKSWKWEVTGWRVWDQLDNHAHNLLNNAPLTAGLASSDPTVAFNPFDLSSPTSTKLLNSALYDLETRFVSDLWAVNAFAQGKLFALPAGDVVGLIGTEYDRESLSQYVTNPSASNSESHYGRNEISIFGEVRVPLLYATDGGQRRSMLSVSSAVRFDRYSDFGNSVVPQFGIEFRPAKSLLLRASYAEAFKAPPLTSISGPVTTYNNTYSISDPKRNGQTYTIPTTIFGANPDLKPETGRSKSIGLVWDPRFAPQLRLSTTWWSVEQEGRITSTTPQNMVNYEDYFPGRIVRGSSTGGLPGQITTVNVSTFNFGTINVEGVDAGITYKIPTAVGTLTPSANAVFIYKFDAGVTPGAPLTDRLSKANTDAWAPRWKINLGMAWDLGAYHASGSARYVSSYLDYQTTANPNMLGDFWTFDLSLGWDIGKTLAPNSGLLSRARLSAGVANITNYLPRYSNFSSGALGYDPSQYDIRGRFAYVDLSLRY